MLGGSWERVDADLAGAAAEFAAFEEVVGDGGDDGDGEDDDDVADDLRGEPATDAVEEISDGGEADGAGGGGGFGLDGGDEILAVVGAVGDDGVGPSVFEEVHEAAGALDEGFLVGADFVAAGGVEGLPAAGGENFNPGVGVGLVDLIVVAEGVVVGALESDDHAGVHAQALAEKSHCAGKVFAVATFPIVEKSNDGIAALEANGVGEVEGVGESGAQMGFDAAGDLFVDIGWGRKGALGTGGDDGLAALNEIRDDA